MSPTGDLYLSVLIPAHNEEKLLERTLREANCYLDIQDFGAEVVVVDDGSTDGTVAAVSRVKRSMPSLRLITYGRRRGKGHAIRVGSLACSGRYLVCMDADGSIPLRYVSNMLKALANGAEIVTGSRYLQGSRVLTEQPRGRAFWDRAGNALASRFLLGRFTDICCGFKGYTQQAAREVLSRTKLSGWGFNGEAIAIANALGMNVVELPIARFNGMHHRISPLRDAFVSARDLSRIKLNLVSGRYDLPSQMAGPSPRQGLAANGR
jgi:glycosyltransferase involved in cell wall biosynthesis